MEALAFESDDVSEIEAFVSAMYSRTSIGPTAGRTHTSITRRVMSTGVAFDDLEYGFEFAFEAEPQRYLVLSDVLRATVRLDGVGGGDNFGPGDMFLVCRPDLPCVGVVRSARLRQLTIDPALFSQVSSSMSGDGEPIQVLDHRPVSAGAAINLRRTIAYLRGNLLAPDGPASTPLVLSAACRYLAACVLDTFPNTAVQVATARDRRDANPDTLRRATSYIDGNPDLDLSVGDIAAAAHVTPRGLQLAFRRHLDTTPMAYVRRIRVDCAHQELACASAGDGTTVTAVAYRWGFSNPSRFARQHRDAYGVSPSETLRS